MNTIPSFERFNRLTPPQYALKDPSVLFDICETASVASLALAFHYDNKLVGSVIPVIGVGEKFKKQPVLKFCVAGSYKPFKEKSEYEKYIRVCAEQNAYDNTLRIGDQLLGFQMNRISRLPEPFEGNGESNEFCLCVACRKRAMKIVGPGFVVVSYTGTESDDVEASTVQQQHDHYDNGLPRTYMARGRDEVKEYIVEEVLKTDQYRKIVESLPDKPSRMYRRPLP